MFCSHMPLLQTLNKITVIFWYLRLYTAILKSRANRHENSNRKAILCFQVQSSEAVTQIFNTISWLLNYVIPSNSEFPLGRFLPADPHCWWYFTSETSCPEHRPSLSPSKPQAEDLVKPLLQIGFHCVRGSGVLPSPRGGRGAPFI